MYVPGKVFLVLEIEGKRYKVPKPPQQKKTHWRRWEVLFDLMLFMM
jgi:hypothetical protein